MRETIFGCGERPTMWANNEIDKESPMSDDNATPQDDDQEPAPSDSSSSDSPEPPPAGEEPEPAPAGEEPEPPPAGEEPEPAPEGEEPPPAASDADSDSSDSDDSDSGKKKHHHKSGSDDSGSSSSSSDDSSSDGGSCMDLSEDDIQNALTAAFQERNVPVDDDGVKVTTVDSMFHLMVRLAADGAPLPQVPDDTSNLAPGSVQGAQLMVVGSVQRLDGGTRVSMRVLEVATSTILQAGQGDAMGTANKDAVQAAAEDALAALDLLHTQ